MKNIVTAYMENLSFIKVKEGVVTVQIELHRLISNGTIKTTTERLRFTAGDTFQITNGDSKRVTELKRKLRSISAHSLD